MKRILTTTLLAVACLFAAASVGCQTETVRGVGAGVSVGADELRREVAAGVGAGEITADEAAFLNPIIDEVQTTAAAVVERAQKWGTMTPAERLTLAGDAVEQIGHSIERLSDKGIGVKSERGRRRLDKYLRQGRRAVAVLRVIQASLPAKS